MAHPENEALLAWLREVLRHQTHDGVAVLADGKSEAMLGMRGDTVVLLVDGEDGEDVVLAKVRLVPE